MESCSAYLNTCSHRTQRNEWKMRVGNMQFHRIRIDVFHVDESTPLFEATTNEYTKLNCRWMTTDYDTNRMKRMGRVLSWRMEEWHVYVCMRRVNFNE